MENNSFQTSFIPKKPVVGNSKTFRPKRKSPGLLSFITTLFILFTILSIAGLYFYKDYLKKEIESKSKSLSITRESLEEKTLLELQTFNKRLNSSKNLLSKHIVISPFFELLNNVTLPQVQFNNFTGVLADNGKGFAVSMVGLAKDYRTVAIQSDILNSSKAKGLSEVSFTDLHLSDEKNSKGYVSFKVSFFIDPSFISFENNILKYKENTNNSTTINNTDINKDLPVVEKLETEDKESDAKKETETDLNKLPNNNTNQ